ncbi:NnrS family protein [Thiohalorhabdus sp.]|uniref:NnrS family protein n=1 Tax=Thiohalorhabdus sp. TaxID=3094134 RepID=UPI002FC31EAE
MADGDHVRDTRPALLREPYRLFFPAGALYALAVMAGWGLWLLEPGSRSAGWPTPVLALAWIHGHTLIWGVLQLFIFGFALTALPRQCRHGEAIPPRRWVALLVAFLVAQAATWSGALGLGAGLAVSGAALGGALILVVAVGFARWVPDAGNPHQPRFAVGALALVGGAAVADALAWATTEPGLHSWAIRAGLYGQMGLALTFLHRLLPMFGRNAFPGYLGESGTRFLPLLGAGLLVRLALAAFPGEAPAVVGGVVDLILAGLVAWQAWHWSPQTALRNWLVGAKLVPVAWFVIGLALSGGVAVGAVWPDAHRAWMHALGVGGMASLGLVFSTRVSLGHAGRLLDPDRWLRTGLWLLQAAVLVRLLAPLWTMPYGGGMMSATHWAAWLWLAAFALWLARLLPRMAEHS